MMMIDKDSLNFSKEPIKTNGQVQEKFNTVSKTVVSLPHKVTVASGRKKLKYSQREVIQYIETVIEDTPDK